MSLPRSFDDCRGLRAALWLRESTQGQFDRFGPAEQRRLYERALETYELVDSGLAWESARSGKTVYRAPAFREMLAAATDRRFDVLVTGYVDRFQRNLRQTLGLQTTTGIVRRLSQNRSRTSRRSGLHAGRAHRQD